MCGFALCVLIYGFIVQEKDPGRKRIQAGKGSRQEKDPGSDRPFRCEVRNMFVVYETTAKAFVLGLL
jgi:hypothetical protein